MHRRDNDVNDSNVRAHADEQEQRHRQKQTRQDEGSPASATAGVPFPDPSATRWGQNLLNQVRNNHAVLLGQVLELQQVRVDIIGHARIKYVGKCQSCMI